MLIILFLAICERQKNSNLLAISVSCRLSATCYTRNTFIFGLIICISLANEPHLEKYKQILEKALFILKQMELTGKIISTKPISNRIREIMQDLYEMRSNECISIVSILERQQQQQEQRPTTLPFHQLEQPFWLSEKNFADFVPTWLGKMKPPNHTMTSCIVFEALVSEIDGLKTCKEIYDFKCEKAPLWLFFTLLHYFEHWKFIQLLPKIEIKTCYRLEKAQINFSSLQMQIIQKYNALFTSGTPIGSAFHDNWNEIGEVVKQLFAIDALKVVN